MDFHDIIKKCNSAGIREHRANEFNYCEIVVDNANIDKWHAACCELMGEPAKREGAKANARVVQVAETYGGIRDSQCLYYHEQYGDRLVAMFWPWRFEPYTTVRMGVSPIVDNDGLKAKPQRNEQVSGFLARQIDHLHHRTLREVEAVVETNQRDIKALARNVKGLTAMVSELSRKLDESQS